MSRRPSIRPAPPRPRCAIGIDVGGTGVKAATVDVSTGELVSSRMRLRTPQPSTPAAVVETIGMIIDSLADQGFADPGVPAGAGLPGVIRAGRLMTAANIDKSWLEVDARAMLAERIGRPVVLVNDADAAGLAEVTFGAAKGRMGTVLVLTIGTGIGSALFTDGHLLRSTEFGHLTFRGREAEALISGAARERRGIGWKRWAREFSEYLALLDWWFSPDLVVLGGGVSKEYAKYERWLTSRAPIVTAAMLNTAGIVGAALAAAMGPAAGDAAAMASTGDGGAGAARAAIETVAGTAAADGADPVPGADGAAAADAATPPADPAAVAVPATPPADPGTTGP
jgi:polyphosphate glucokinase